MDILLETHLYNWGITKEGANIMIQNQGMIQPCLHCNGTGKCNAARETARFEGQWFAKMQDVSCVRCRIKAGVAADFQCKDLVCSVCDGKGSVWIGPEVR